MRGFNDARKRTKESGYFPLIAAGIVLAFLLMLAVFDPASQFTQHQGETADDLELDRADREAGFVPADPDIPPRGPGRD